MALCALSTHLSVASGGPTWLLGTEAERDRLQRELDDLRQQLAKAPETLVAPLRHQLAFLWSMGGCFVGPQVL